nr:MAG TPA: hypothetical protein [Caudoviricetes sp.]
MSYWINRHFKYTFFWYILNNANSLRSLDF